VKKTLLRGVMAALMAVVVIVPGTARPARALDRGLGAPDSALEPVRRDKGTTLAGGILSVSRSSVFSAVITPSRRTRCGGLCAAV
jgi:hypothetical protein